MAATAMLCSVLPAIPSGTAKKSSAAWKRFEAGSLHGVFCGALPLLLLCVAMAAIIPAVMPCSLPPGSCQEDKCNALANLKPPSSATMDKKIGFYYGIWNKNINSGNAPGFESVRGGPYVNYEVFPAIEVTYLITGVDTSGATTLPSCCNLCARTVGCALFQFFTKGNWAQISTGFGVKATNRTLNFVDGQQCYLLTGGSVQGKAEGLYGSPFSGTHSQQIDSNSTAFPNQYYPPSWVGGGCNPNVSVIDDPHFVGAHGTHFDFNGEVDKYFCLLTDQKIHINIKLGGYQDSRSTGASVLENGKIIRTWIREVGILWKADDGSQHTAFLVARSGKQQERGDGFLAGLQVDGRSVAVPAVGETASEGLFTLKSEGVERKGIYDVESLSVGVRGLLGLGIKMRPAHPLLQTADDAQVHFNLHIDSIELTDNVHGVLGQTYRSSSSQNLKSFEYKLLGKLLGRPIAADGKSGLGFLDGESSDYETAGILNPECKFSAFM